MRFLDLSERTTLRNVIRRRELEQERAVIDTHAGAIAHCPGCGGRLYDGGQLICSRCRKRAGGSARAFQRREAVTEAIHDG